MLQGVTHGAVDFLIKPVRQEELRNVWQHVVRRKLQVWRVLRCGLCRGLLLACTSAVLKSFGVLGCVVDSE